VCHMIKLALWKHTHHKGSTLLPDATMSQCHPPPILRTYLPKNHLNTALPSPSFLCLPALRFPRHIPTNILHAFTASPTLDVTVVTRPGGLYAMYFTPPHRPVFTHSQFMLLHDSKNQVLHPRSTTR